MSGKRSRYVAQTSPFIHLPAQHGSLLCLGHAALHVKPIKASNCDLSLFFVQTTKEKEESALQECAKEEENLMNRRVMFQSKRDDLLRKIRDLGSLPADAFEKWVPENPMRDWHSSTSLQPHEA